MKKEIILVKITRMDQAEPYYVPVQSREDVSETILRYRAYINNKTAKFEVLECEIKHCTKAEVKVFW